MNATLTMKGGKQNPRERFAIAVLICFHIVVCCVSLIHVANSKHANLPDPWSAYFIYDPARLAGATVVIAAFALVAVFFIFSNFSFGYFAGFYLYTMVLGYLWLSRFTDLDYDHRLAGFSAAASMIAFLLPALLISSPFRQMITLSESTFERLLTFILVLAAATIAIGAFYNFRVVALSNIYDFRDQLYSPAPVRYLLGITSSALLPFSFACFVARGQRWKAGAALVLLLLYYPITLSKLAFFAPLWLVFIAAVTSVFSARIGVILSLFAPLLAGTMLAVFFNGQPAIYFDTVNFRMFAVPSGAFDLYNDFFSKHDLTAFCQVSFLKPVMSCPYQEQLSLVMKRAYGLGNMNASLFATEGIASVGPWVAPGAVLVCGFAVSVGNRASAGLPPGFVLVSAAILPHALLNVPLTTVLLTHGAGVLFLLWYVTPRAMFEANRGSLREVQQPVQPAEPQPRIVA
jgi:hypothetical protein